MAQKTSSPAPQKSGFISGRHAFSLFFVATSLIAPAFIMGSGGFDLPLQSLWIRHFSAQFWQGNLYPRWLMDMFAGNGSPVFFYYPPLTYFITAFFTFLPSEDAFIYTSISVSAWLALIISAFGFYSWMKEETNNANAALLGSVLYIAAPQNMGWNFYCAMLLSSVWAYAWVPLLLRYAKKLALGKPHGIVGFAFFLCLLIMTNLPMTLMWGPIAVAYCLLYVNWRYPVKSILKLGAALLLGFGMSAIYLLPALALAGAALVNTHWIQPRDLLVFTFDTPNMAILTALWFALAALILLYGKIILPISRKLLFFPAIGIAALLMMVPVSSFIWKHVAILKILQFPERLFTVPFLALAVLAAMILPRFRPLAYGLCLICIGCVFALSYLVRYSVEDYRDDHPKEYALYQLNIEQYWNYLTAENLVKRYYSEEGIKEVQQHPDPVERIEGDAKTEIKKWQPRDMAIEYTASHPSTLRIRQFYFPGFTATFNDQAISLKREESTGQIIVMLPAGEGMIHLQLTRLMPELVGIEISLLSIAIMLIILLTSIKKELSLVPTQKKYAPR